MLYPQHFGITFKQLECDGTAITDLAANKSIDCSRSMAKAVFSSGQSRGCMIHPS